MKHGIKKKIPKAIMIAAALILFVSLVITGIMLYGKYQISKIPNLSFREALAYTTGDNEEAVITVGIIRDGKKSFKVYGENGSELPAEIHTYEIGSVTKTITAALINKATVEKKVNLDDTIEQYLSLPDGNEYPTIEELLTHTSGYKGYYFESPMISNFFKGRNDFYGITREMILERAGGLNMDESYGFSYSNYGYALLGLVLEAVYDTSYTTLANDFLQRDLGLTGTGVGRDGDLGNYWEWDTNDAYLPAGAVTSNITDMLTYAQLQLEGNPYFSGCHKSLKAIHASSGDYEAMGIRMDEIGMSWIIDKENDIIWHNGGTGHFNSYIGFHMETETAVVVLSNLAPNYRIPATVLGVKLLTEQYKGETNYGDI